MAEVLAGPSTLRDIIRPQFHQLLIPEENIIKNDLGIKLDKGMHYRSKPQTKRLTQLTR